MVNWLASTNKPLYVGDPSGYHKHFSEISNDDIYYPDLTEDPEFSESSSLKVEFKLNRGKLKYGVGPGEFKVILAFKIKNNGMLSNNVESTQVTFKYDFTYNATCYSLGYHWGPDWLTDPPATVAATFDFGNDDDGDLSKDITAPTVDDVHAEINDDGRTIYPKIYMRAGTMSSGWGSWKDLEGDPEPTLDGGTVTGPVTNFISYIQWKTSHGDLATESGQSDKIHSTITTVTWNVVFDTTLPSFSSDGTAHETIIGTFTNGYTADTSKSFTAPTVTDTGGDATLTMQYWRLDLSTPTIDTTQRTSTYDPVSNGWVSATVNNSDSKGDRRTSTTTFNLYSRGGLGVHTDNYLIEYKAEDPRGNTRYLYRIYKLAVSYTHLRAHETPEHLV